MKTKELTKNEKLVKTIERISNYLNAKEKEKYKIRYCKNFYDSRQTIKTLIKAECNFLNVNNIPLPYPDTFLAEVNENNICIIGDNMEINFTPDQILNIYNELKKIAKN